MAKYVKVSNFLDDQLPPKYRKLIPSTIRKAYKAADDLAKGEPILEVTSALNNRGRIRAWATDLAFERLINTGEWPFEYSWQNFKKPTGKYLQVRLNTSLMSVSLVADPTYVPRKVGFRENNALGNPSPFLFDEMNEEERVSGLPSFILVHGHQAPEFAHIGMPNPTGNNWMYKTSNLFNIPHTLDSFSETTPIEAEDEDAVLSLKDDILKWQRDNKNE